MEEREYFEDFSVGEKFVSQGRTITEALVTNFAALTGDWTPLHVDAEFARTTYYGERIAHGMLILAVGHTLGFMLGRHMLAPKSFIAFYGLDQVRFTGPVMIGDTIRQASEVIEMTPKDEQTGIITFSRRIINQRDADVCVYSCRILAGRRP